MAGPLAGKVALVTGASSGIGQAAAVEAGRGRGRRGAQLHSTTAEAEKTAAEIRKLGRKATAVQGGRVRPGRPSRRWWPTRSPQLGRVDVFVSSAVYSDREPFLTADMAGFRKTIEVSHVRGVLLPAGGVQPDGQAGPGRGGGDRQLARTPRSRSRTPWPTTWPRPAIDQMMRTAARELLPHKIRVNSCYPGWTDTPGERKFFSEETIAKAGEGAAVGPAGDVRGGRPGDPVPGRPGVRLHHRRRSCTSTAGCSCRGGRSGTRGTFKRRGRPSGGPDQPSRHGGLPTLTRSSPSTSPRRSTNGCPSGSNSSVWCASGYSITGCRRLGNRRRRTAASAALSMIRSLPAEQQQRRHRHPLRRPPQVDVEREAAEQEPGRRHAAGRSGSSAMNCCHSGDAVNRSGSLSGIGKNLPRPEHPGDGDPHPLEERRRDLRHAARGRAAPARRPAPAGGTAARPPSFPPHEMPPTNTGSQPRSARRCWTNSATSSSSRRKLGRVAAVGGVQPAAAAVEEEDLEPGLREPPARPRVPPAVAADAVDEDEPGRGRPGGSKRR